MKAIQWLVAISGTVNNHSNGVARGDVMDVDGENLTEATALQYIKSGLAVEVHGRPLDTRDLPPGYRLPGAG
jgi:hypothetical protein